MPNDLQPSMSQSLLLQIIEQLSGVDQRIGVLQGQNSEILREQARAADGRAAIYAKVNKIDTLEAELERLSPLVDAHEKQRNQAAGAIWLGRTLWAAGAGAIGAAATFAMQWISGAHQHHP